MTQELCLRMGVFKNLVDYIFCSGLKFTFSGEHKIESKGLNKPFFEYKGLEVF